MVNSMTGFAAQPGQSGDYIWNWDLRSLNSKGMDLRLRVPDWVDGLEAALRTRIGKAAKRGSLTIGLKLSREVSDGTLSLDPDGLAAALTALMEVGRAAEVAGVKLAPASAADLLSMKGVQGQGAQNVDTKPLRAALLEDFETVLAAFLDMRAREGAALAAILYEQLDRIEALRADAAACLDARAAASALALRAALARVLENADGADEGRVAQELAMLSVKADITEELDRLAAHVEAARALLETDGPVGRKLEFLTQEFNREANTLCSKSQDVALTSIGLDLKAVIDQMREQVQNVE
ncbi:YicC/YloC family endoribonuclease [Tropicimonas sp. TH_r6]|uniref:YicC/YloC family endoribonuclease n=1 Tax=Tropicimonas sp. TH_r6 TaxID=3082085 RepID=UPI002955747A|nr:YicC/YloC family endoribonuclease [Tropicimonas sp. TH_r6]MDV7141705.1 YicC/YloC family endoribonuclease [Tropicimonas sp. TH_r6]